jgi:hypothetical protein
MAKKLSFDPAWIDYNGECGILSQSVTTVSIEQQRLHALTARDLLGHQSSSPGQQVTEKSPIRSMAGSGMEELKL